MKTIVLALLFLSAATSLAQDCGDGFRVASEECDDGNTVSDDGCSSTCVIEEGYICYGGSETSADVCADLGEGTQHEVIVSSNFSSQLSFGAGSDKELQFEVTYNNVPESLDIFMGFVDWTLVDDPMGSGINTMCNWRLSINGAQIEASIIPTMTQVQRIGDTLTVSFNTTFDMLESCTRGDGSDLFTRESTEDYLKMNTVMYIGASSADFDIQVEMDQYYLTLLIPRNLEAITQVTSIRDEIASRVLAAEIKSTENDPNIVYLYIQLETKVYRTEAGEGNFRQLKLVSPYDDSGRVGAENTLTPDAAEASCANDFSADGYCTQVFTFTTVPTGNVSSAQASWDGEFVIEFQGFDLAGTGSTVDNATLPPTPSISIQMTTSRMGAEVLEADASILNLELGVYSSWNFDTSRSVFGYGQKAHVRTTIKYEDGQYASADYAHNLEEVLICTPNEEESVLLSQGGCDAVSLPRRATMIAKDAIVRDLLAIFDQEIHEVSQTDFAFDPYPWAVLMQSTTYYVHVKSKISFIQEARRRLASSSGSLSSKEATSSVAVFRVDLNEKESETEQVSEKESSNEDTATSYATFGMGACGVFVGVAVALVAFKYSKKKSLSIAPGVSHSETVKQAW